MLIESKWAAAWLLAATLLAGCSTPAHRAPVEDRAPATKPQVVAAAPVPASAASAPAELIVAKPLPGAENAGKPGYYTVKAGDTLIRIGLDSGQSAKDLVKWNNLENPNVVEVGQVLRVVPPGIDAAGAASKPIASSRVEARPLDARPAAAGVSAAPVAATSASNAASASTVVVPALPAATSAPASAADEDVRWAWPANGNVIAPFDESKVKGLLIGGKAGDPVYAAADGRVVYAGSGLRGYGNLIILKHNNTYLTAYAHNQTLLVKEDQSVRRGQKIAEMGSTDSDSVKLHFEIRKMGRPIDPAKLLPPR
jgi:lipoprotein NlpD